METKKQRRLRVNTVTADTKQAPQYLKQKTKLVGMERKRLNKPSEGRLVGPYGPVLPSGPRGPGAAGQRQEGAWTTFGACQDSPHQPGASEEPVGTFVFRATAQAVVSGQASAGPLLSYGASGHHPEPLTPYPLPHEAASLSAFHRTHK